MTSVSYYPGCSLEGSSREYDESSRAVFELLGIELHELDDWNCCGASSAHMTNDYLALALGMRNLMIAQKEGLDLVVPCMACFNRLKRAEKEGPEDPAVSREFPYEGRVRIMHLLDFLRQPDVLEMIGNKSVKPLEGLQVVPYYGCLYVRPPKVTDVSDYEDPCSMDELLKAIGCRSLNWSFKTDCCGGNLALSRTDLLMEISGRLLEMAEEAGAEALVAACPLCQANLDTREQEISRKRGRDFGLPIFFITELIAISLGHPGARRWLARHMVDPVPLLESKGLL